MSDHNGNCTKSIGNFSKYCLCFIDLQNSWFFSLTSGKLIVIWESIIRVSALRDPDGPSVCWQRELRLRLERQTPEDREGVHTEHQRLQELSFGIKLRALVRKQTHSNIRSSDGSSERTRQKCCKNTPIGHPLIKYVRTFFLTSKTRFFTSRAAAESYFAVGSASASGDFCFLAVVSSSSLFSGIVLMTLQLV